MRTRYGRRSFVGMVAWTALVVACPLIEPAIVRQWRVGEGGAHGESGEGT